MRYVRTKDGKIVDIEKFINEEKDTPYYKDFEFEEISKDGQLKWTAIGTEENSIKDQIGRRCHFSATLNSEIISQSNTIEELCDEYVICLFGNPQTITKNLLEIHHFIVNQKLIRNDESIVIYGAIWTEWGLKYVACTNSEGELELL